MSRQVWATGIALAAVLSLGASAQAQTTRAPAASASGDDGGLEEVTIFAQKRSEPLQSVPAAVTAVTAAEISEWGLHSSNDLQSVTPNLTIGSVYQGTTPQLTLRGVGVNDGIETTAPSVGTYIDQVYLGDAGASAIQMFDMDRVEVLRGPQGTLYGKNTNGGALNLYSKGPTDTFAGDVAIEAGNYMERGGSGFVSGPLSGPELTGRVAVFFRDRDGYGQILAPGPVAYSPDDVWAEHTYGVRTSLKYKPTDNSEWLLTAVNGRNRVTYGWPMHGLRDPNNLANDCANPYADTCVDALGERVYGFNQPYSTIQDKLSSTTIETTMAVLRGTWTLGSVNLSSVTGYVHTHIRLTDDGASDYVGPGDLFFFDQDKHTNQYSEEFRVASVGGQRFNWTTGVFWSTDRFRGPTTYEFSLSPGTTDVSRTTDSYAVFAQSDYAFTPTVKLTTGLRYSNSKLTSSSTNLGGFSNSATDSWGSVGGRLALEKRLNDSTLTYVSYNRGFKEGNVSVGIYGTARPGRVSTIKPEFIDAFELGVKSDINRRLRINADIYYNKLKDMQVAGTDPTNFNFPTVTNAAKATTYGLELEVTARPVPDLSISAAYGYLHAAFENYYVLSVFTPAPAFPAVLVNASGNPVPLSPENTFSTQVSYTAHLGEAATMTPRVNYSYRSKQAFTPEGYIQRGSQSGYGLLGAGLQFETPGNFEVDVWGRNLTDEAYLVDMQSGDSFNGADFPTYGTPRMYGITVRKKF